MNDQTVKEFMEIGKRIRDSNDTGLEEIVNLIKEKENVVNQRVYENQDVMNPYLFVENSSGSGKTQLAFTLMSMKEIFPNVVYVPIQIYVAEGHSSQNIYAPFSTATTQLDNCILEDLKQFQGKEVLRIEDNQKLQIYGFFREYLKGKIVTNPPKISRDEFLVYLKKENFSPLVILDEMQQGDARGERYVRLLRNAFRKIPVVLILMSRNSSAASMATTIKGPGLEKNPYEWVTIITRLPKFVPPENFHKALRNKVVGLLPVDYTKSEEVNIRN